MASADTARIERMVSLTQPGLHIDYCFMRRPLSSTLYGWLPVFTATAALLAAPLDARSEEDAVAVPPPEVSPVEPAAAPSPAKDSSAALTGEAWSAFDRKDFAAARAAIERCQSLYAAKAAEMQGSLAALPGKENAHDQWALNDVGTCTFLLGKVAEAEGKNEEAMAAYKTVVDQYSYAQCWDEQGWFWQPAVAAKERMAFITLEKE